jgi:PAS domain S-box-containing protein
MEQRLRDQIALTEAIVRQVPNAVFTKDAQGRFTMVNRGWSEMSGVAAEDAIGKTVHEIYAPELAQRFAGEDAKLMAQGALAAPIEAVHQGPRPNQWRIVRKAVLCREDGTVLGVVASSTDISELKRIESELRDQFELTRALIEASPTAMYLKDTHARYVTMNDAWLAMVGVTREQAVGRNVLELFPEKESERYLAEDMRLLAQGSGSSEVESLRTGPDGKPQWLIVRKAVLHRADGTVAGLIGANTDITKLKRYEAELADRAKFISELVDALPVSIALRDTEYRFLMVNRTWEDYFGVSRVHALGKRFIELPGWKDNPELVEVAAQAEGIDREVIARGEAAPMRLERHRLGRSYLNTRQVFADTAGSVVGVLATGVDITERKAMEEALKRAEREAADRAKFIGELVDALPISVAMRDVEGRYVLVNRMWERYFGVQREQALGRRRRELPGWQADPARVQDADEIERVDREMLARGPDDIAETEEVSRLGRSYLMTRRVLADSAGTPLGVLSAGMDMTERRAMEQALAIEQRRLDLVVRAAKMGTLDWDGRTRTAYYSPRFLEILGYPPDFDTSRWSNAFEILIHPDDKERVYRAFREHILGTGPEGRAERHPTMEYRLRRADGSYVWVEAQGVAVRDASGFATRFIAAYTDITERRAQEEELRQSVRLREEVERMSRHDLKTPLNSVIAMARLLREAGRVAPEDAELLGTIERAGYRILNMVNLSLDLFRMETGTYQFHPQAVDVAEVARRVAADLESQAASKNIEVRVRANGVSAKTQEVFARGDELLCYSMFANLVKNAIEASPADSTVSISVTAKDGAVRAEVHNAGAVPEAMRKRFFRKYATTGKSAGLGLGTYSARLMARVQGGDLALETSEESGTTLVARLEPAGGDLPRARESRAQLSTQAETIEALPALNLLVVDDDEFNRLVLRRCLPAPPLSVAFAVNGRAALDAAATAWPDVVLLDLEMPVMDGYEAARRLREMERTRNLKRCRIVAISANDEGSIVQRALAAGCDHYVVKPAPRQLLWSLLAGSAPAEAAHPGVPAEASASDAVRVDAELRQAIPEFLRSRRGLLDDMPAALAASDRALFRRLAHRLAGSFALYGFKWAAAEARAIEADAPLGDPARLLERVAGLRAHLDGVTVEYSAPPPP